MKKISINIITRMKVLFLLLFLLLPLLVSGVSEAIVHYPTVIPTDLGTLGGSYSHAVSINNFGQAVGDSYFDSSNLRHGFIWSSTNGMEDLGTLGGPESVAQYINDAGQVMGQSDTNNIYSSDGSSGLNSAFIWTRSNGMVNIGNLGVNFNGHFKTTALGMSDNGQVVGLSLIPDGNAHAFSWTSASGIVDLGTLPGDNWSYASGVNTIGEIIGASRNTIAGTERAFLWTPTNGMTEIGPLPGGDFSRVNAINNNSKIVGNSNKSIGDGSDYATQWDSSLNPTQISQSVSNALSLNNSGQVAGNNYFPGMNREHGYFWSQDQGLVDIGTLGGDYSDTEDLNNNGQVVGYSSTGEINSANSFISRGFSWTLSGGMYDLSTLGGDGSVAIAVNDHGQIVGDSNISGGSLGSTGSHAVLWQTGLPVGTQFIGFANPVNNPNVLNIVKSGKAVPLKWQLLDSTGNPVTNLTNASISVNDLDCSTSASSDQITQLVNTGSMLKNLGGGNYALDWKTSNTYAGTCKVMHLNIGDGISHNAFFQFKQ